MVDHDTLIEIRTKVTAIYDKVDCMEKKVMYKDACAANLSGDSQRMDHIEGDVKELKDGNNNRLTFGIAILAVIVAIIIPIATAFIH